MQSIAPQELYSINERIDFMRLLTRSDFDGLICGAVLKQAGVIDHWKFVHPKDIQDGIIEVTENDVLANIPYAKGCGMWFDHHSSEAERVGLGIEFKGESRLAPSCAGIVYEYYGGKETMPQFEEMIKAVDKVDSANLTIEEVLNPQGWIFLGFIMDPRTGLGRFRNFTISNLSLMDSLIEICRTTPIDEILELPNVKERVDVYNEQSALFKEMLLKHSRVDGNVIITDLRGVDVINAGNRFIIYSLFPEQNISIWITDGKGKLNCPIAVGYSIINRTSKTDVGHLLLKHGGGGHKQVGTCQVDYPEVDRVVAELVEQMKIDG